LRWTDEDRAKALAYERWRGSACPRCGTHQDDWYEADGTLRRDPEWQPIVVGCKGCEDTAALDKHVGDDAKRDGARVALIPTSDYDPDSHDRYLDEVGEHRPQ
jgi:hypothetical protein